MGDVTYRLAVPWLLKPLEVGQRVTVAWDEAAGPRQARIAQAVSIERA